MNRIASRLPALCFAIFALLFMASASARPQQGSPTAAVSATVVDPQGAAGAGGGIDAAGVGSSGAPLTSKTDEAGIFRVSLEPGQIYLLQVHADGFAPFAETVVA